MKGRSYNDFTGENLKVIDLIPVFSFLIFKGRDRVSNKKLPLSYPFFEFINGVIVLSAYLKVATEVLSTTELISNYLILFVLIQILLFLGMYDFISGVSN